MANGTITLAARGSLTDLAEVAPIYSYGKYAKELATMNDQGIILFEWQGRIPDFGATGHVDLAEISRGMPVCEGHCYFVSGPMKAYFWSTQP